MGGNLRARIGRNPLAALIVFCVLAWLPGFFTLPPLDRDESRFAQATKQMLETGDFIDINLGGVPRYEKPVGIYWMQAISTAVLGAGARDHIWTYRVPSLLGALAAVIATFFMVRAFAGATAGFWAGMLLGFSVLLMSEAKIAKTDAFLTGAIAAAQLVLMRAYLSAREPERFAAPSLRLALFGWAAFGLGILVKGPVVVLVCGATLLALSAWDRDLSWLKRLRAGPGVLAVLAIVLPWAIAIGIASAGAFYQKSLGGDFAAKLVGEQETHGAPPGYYALLMHLTFWPASFALLPGIAAGIARRREPAVRFLLLWAVTTWLMFEIAPTKLPHYVLPAYPALAALSALWLTDVAAKQGLGMRVARIVSFVFYALAAIALAAFLVWAPQRFGNAAPWWLYAAAAFGALVALSAIAWRERTSRAAAACLGAALLYAVAGFATVPRLTELWLSPRMADAVARYSQPGDPPVVTAGYAEPSITFLLGTATGLDDGPTAGAAASAAGGLALVDSSETQPFLDAVAQAGARAAALEEIEGLNYSRGRATHITLYRVTPAAR
jgi:4-amino-4-deoxy-L-arabinose transferase-like glycosyltransferase